MNSQVTLHPKNSRAFRRGFAPPHEDKKSESRFSLLTSASQTFVKCTINLRSIALPVNNFVNPFFYPPHTTNPLTRSQLAKNRPLTLPISKPHARVFLKNKFIPRYASQLICLQPYIMLFAGFVQLFRTQEPPSFLRGNRLLGE
jgi:hypothetical protein